MRTRSAPDTNAPGRRYAPGARVEIRDELWIVRGVEVTATGGHALRVVGVSDLVRGRDAVFLDDLDAVTVLDPRATDLVYDDSPRHRRARLWLESLLRRSSPTTAALAVGHRGAMHPTRYQRVPAARALARPRARILLADGVGLGKTIEVGILLAELIRRGRGRRILVVTLRSVLAQFQEELWARFTVPLVRLDATGLRRVQQRIPATMNPFHVHERAIISIDTLKKDERYRRYLQDCRWDVVVIDECQHVAERTTHRGEASMRARLARLLADTCESLILTSATPHDGRPESFASLIELLDPTAITDPTRFTHDEIAGLVVRRFKKDIEHEVGAAFQDRTLVAHHVTITPAEEALFAALADVDLAARIGGGALFCALLRKAALSSADALIATLDERAHNLRLRAAAADHDLASLAALRRLAEAAAGAPGAPPAKVAHLLALLTDLGVATPGDRTRVVVFSERLQTLDSLAVHLKRGLGLADDAIGVFTGALDDAAQQALVHSFAARDSPVRVLLASDAAAEGINLHYHCHHLVHFDIPWSLITLEQRNGRIDRFGQRHRPELHHLLAVPTAEHLRGDLRVLERLIMKEHEAHKHLCDVQFLLRLHDAHAEEAHVLAGIAAGEAPDEIVPDLPADDRSPAPIDATEVAVAVQPTLYADDLQFTIEALDELASVDREIAPARRHPHGLAFAAPPDLLRRFDLLPPELRPGSTGTFRLTTDRTFLMRELERARERRDAWPEWQLLWELHPICEWLGDRLIAHMGRHAAPIVRVRRGLADGRACFLVQGVLTDRRGRPAIDAWFGVDRSVDAPPIAPTITPLADLVPRLALHDPGDHGPAVDPAPLLRLREPVVDAAREHMARLRESRRPDLDAAVAAEIRRLEAWAAARREQLAAGLAREPRAAHRNRTHEHMREVEALCARRSAGSGDARVTDGEPFIRLAAVFVPADGHELRR